MTKYIVHKGTGTIIAVDECVIVDVPEEVTDEITAHGGEDYFDEEVILDLAVENGKPIVVGLPSDSSVHNTMVFSPEALRMEARERLGWAYYTNDEGDNPFHDEGWGLPKEQYEWWKWLATEASDEALESISRSIAVSSHLWEEFDLALKDALLREFIRRHGGLRTTK
jgi:hypothetical protein